MSTAGPLDLSGADLKGFEALDAGRYDAEVFEMIWDIVKNASGKGKLPAGTPMLKVQFKLLNPMIGGETIDQDRRVFGQYPVPPKDYDKQKAAIMNGMIARLFIGLGDTEETVKSATFEPDLQDYISRPCVVTISKDPKKDATGAIVEGEFNNPVKGVKPAGSGAGINTGLL